MVLSPLADRGGLAYITTVKWCKVYISDRYKGKTAMDPVGGGFGGGMDGNGGSNGGFS